MGRVEADRERRKEKERRHVCRHVLLLSQSRVYLVVSFCVASLWLVKVIKQVQN